jgi:hypothetical protein
MFCPHCAHRLKIRLEFIGRRVKCRHCSLTLKVPRHVKIRCKHCDHEGQVGTGYLGKVVLCKRCAEKVLVDVTAYLPQALMAPPELDGRGSDRGGSQAGEPRLTARLNQAQRALEAARDRWLGLRSRLGEGADALGLVPPGPDAGDEGPGGERWVDALLDAVRTRVEALSLSEEALGRSRAEIERLEGLARDAAARAEAAGAELASDRDRRAELERAVADTSRLVEELRAARDGLAAEAAAARRAEREAADRARDLEARNAALAATVEALKDEAAALRQEAARARHAAVPQKDRDEILHLDIALGEWE